MEALDRNYGFPVGVLQQDGILSSKGAPLWAQCWGLLVGRIRSSEHRSIVRMRLNHHLAGLEVADTRVGEEAGKTVPAVGKCFRAVGKRYVGCKVDHSSHYQARCASWSRPGSEVDHSGYRQCWVEFDVRATRTSFASEDSSLL